MKRSSIFARVSRLISKEKTAGGITPLITSRNKSLSTRRRPVVDNKGSGERGRNRTFNLLIKSQLLCQLSYAPIYLDSTSCVDLRGRRGATLTKLSLRTGLRVPASTVFDADTVAILPAANDAVSTRRIASLTSSVETMLYRSKTLRVL